MRIWKTDLSSADDWKAYDPSPKDYPNALMAMGYAYSHDDAFWIKVNQHVVMYSNAVEAQARYQQEFQRMLGCGPSPIVEFSGHADRMNIHCLKYVVDNVPHDACEFFGVYEITLPDQETKYYYFGGQRVAMRRNGELAYLHADHGDNDGGYLDGLAPPA